MNETKKLLAEGIERIRPEDWRNCVQHVINKVEPQYWSSDNLQYVAVQPMIIDLNDDDDSEDDFDALFPEQ